MRKTFISLSGGVESTTMCLLYGENASAIWCDTGAEHKIMYDRIDFLEKKLQEIYKDFKIIRLKNEKHIGLEEYVIKRKFMPSGMQRYCTRLFKIEPIDAFLKEQGECDLLIGFNADEEDRIGNLKKLSNVNYRYPLIEDGFTRNDCEIILNNKGFHPNFPAYMLRGGCRMCFFKSEKEYKALWFLNREEFNEMIDFETKYQDTRSKKYTILNNKSLMDINNECQQSLFYDEIVEMLNQYKKQNNSCGAFCHR